MPTKAPGRPRTFNGSTEHKIALKFLKLTQTERVRETVARKHLAEAYKVPETLISAVVKRRRAKAAEHIAKVRAGSAKFWNAYRAQKATPVWKRWLRSVIR